MHSNRKRGKRDRPGKGWKAWKERINHADRDWNKAFDKDEGKGREIENKGKQKNKEKAFDINLALISPRRRAKDNINSESINNFIETIAENCSVLVKPNSFSIKRSFIRGDNKPQKTINNKIKIKINR